jgi:HNH endonuclease
MDASLTKRDLFRFEAKFKKGSPMDCWIWNAGKFSNFGYGSFRLFGRSQYAHRVAFLINKGVIPDGLEVMHSCDNPACVNHFHLSLGTHAENMRDASIKNRLHGGDKSKWIAENPGFCAGSRNGSSKLNEAQASEIKSLLLKGKLTQGQIGMIFGVSNHTICRINKGKNWTHVIALTA